MKLRPHHLLCTQGYEGMGYSGEFTAHMDSLVERLRNEPGLTIDLVRSDDDICAHCPKLMGPDRCAENDSVKEYDRKVMEYFQLREGSYVYANLARDIRAKMTSDILEDICGSCSWYRISKCRKVLLSL